MTLGSQVEAPTAPVPPRARIAPLARERFALQVTVSRETRGKLRHAQALLAHAVPGGDVAEVLDRALDALIAPIERRKCAAAAKPRPASPRRAKSTRRVPAHVRREVWRRDGGRCTFVSERGHRCEARSRLELDHVTPVARGGESTGDNLRLRCRAHNRHAADLAFGAAFMRRKRETGRAPVPGPTRTPTPTRAAVPASERVPVPAPTPPGLDVTPWLRQLGFRPDEVRRGASLCAELGDATLEQRVRHALRHLAPARHRREPLAASS